MARQPVNGTPIPNLHAIRNRIAPGVAELAAWRRHGVRIVGGEPFEAEARGPEDVERLKLQLMTTLLAFQTAAYPLYQAVRSGADLFFLEPCDPEGEQPLFLFRFRVTPEARLDIDVTALLPMIDDRPIPMIESRRGVELGEAQLLMAAMLPGKLWVTDVWEDFSWDSIDHHGVTYRDDGVNPWEFDEEAGNPRLATDIGRLPNKRPSPSLSIDMNMQEQPSVPNMPKPET